MTEFLKEIRKKDKNAVQALYTRYGKKLYGYAVVQWKLSEDDAWDIVYATLYKTIQVIDRYTFEEEKKFVGFIYTMFTNNLRNHYNKHKERRFETAELKEEHGHTLKQEEGSHVPESTAMKCLEKGLAEMEDWKRVVLLMRAQEYSYEEIATYVNRPTDQLKVYYMRLKKLLTEKINECIDTVLNGR